jgi:hypothetical protein
MSGFSQRMKNDLTRIATDAEAIANEADTHFRNLAGGQAFGHFEFQQLVVREIGQLAHLVRDLARIAREGSAE